MESAAKDIKSILERVKSSVVVSGGEAIDKPIERQICNPSCEICGGFGFYRVNVPIGHPSFGKLLRCPNVDILSLPGSDKYGLEHDELFGLDWSSIYPLEDSRCTEAAEIVRKILDRGYGWIYLWGDHGQAKSLILKIAVATRLRNNVMASYVNMADLVSNLREAFDTDHPSFEAESRLDFWRDIPILAIDEIDRVNNTSWVAEQRFRLLDSRYVTAIRRESVTIMASNRSPNFLDPYLADRVLDGRFVVMELRGVSARFGMSDLDRF